MTAKQKRFVEEYLVDLNMTQAAIRAGYSPKTAKVIAHEIMEKADIADAIAKAQAKQSKRTGITADRVLREYAKIAFANLSDIVDTKTGTVLPTASKDDLSCIQSVKVKDTDIGTEREVRLYDKQKALDALAKHLGIAKEKIELDISPVVLAGYDDIPD